MRATARRAAHPARRRPARLHRRRPGPAAPTVRHASRAPPRRGGTSGAADEIHGESGDDTVYAGSGNDVVFGDGERRRPHRRLGARLDLRRRRRRRRARRRRPDLHQPQRAGRAAVRRHGRAGSAAPTITTPGSVQTAVINVDRPAEEGGRPDAVRQPDRPRSDRPAVRPRSTPTTSSTAAWATTSCTAAAGDDAMSGAEALPDSYAANGAGGLVRSDWYTRWPYFNILRTAARGPGCSPSTTSTTRCADQLNADGTLQQDRRPSPAVAAELRRHRGPLARAHRSTADRRRRQALRRPRRRLAGRRHRPRHALRRLGQRPAQRRRQPRPPTAALNNAPDTNASYEDRAFGGAGLRRADRQHRRRPADRLGGRVQQLPRAVRAVRRGHDQPHAAAGADGVPVRPVEAQGADQTLVQLTGGDAARNGEPFGELGMVRQQDCGLAGPDRWPARPAAGNIPGGSARRAPLGDLQQHRGGSTGSSSTGDFSSSNGALAVTAASLGGDAAACSTSSTRTCRCTSSSAPRS